MKPGISLIFLKEININGSGKIRKTSENGRHFLHGKPEEAM